MFRHNDELEIQLLNTDDQPPYTVFGKFKSMDDEYIRVVGTVGDQIGKTVLVPKTQVKVIYLLKRASDV